MASKSEEIQSQYMKYFKKYMIHLNLLTNQSIWIYGSWRTYKWISKLKKYNYLNKSKDLIINIKSYTLCRRPRMLKP